MCTADACYKTVSKTALKTSIWLIWKIASCVGQGLVNSGLVTLLNTKMSAARREITFYNWLLHFLNILG